ncbi:hypothetical protein [Janthinobacterium fluminis]|uniref:Cupin domain-containing protein n=1 Tax=Janthinobacterium fluminis TaxID=2987524 RepID=A0ABT5K4H8_9BURK|nr:hypothetical protein [Janthinobacterium fluminis]MDC8759600.1 hypothetical protein [Janthinobacterium fluminis]
MDFKEYSFDPDIRVCVYNVGDENLEYHKHTCISDITYCAAGRLILELPEINKSYVFHPGQIIQVPYDTVHRVSHFSKTEQHSRYVLVQIGKFSIEFIRDDSIVFGENKMDMQDKSLNYYIGENHENIKRIAASFKAQRPENLSDQEYADVLAALAAVCNKGIPQVHTNDVIMQQLKELESL